MTQRDECLQQVAVVRPRTRRSFAGLSPAQRQPQPLPPPRHHYNYDHNYNNDNDGGGQATKQPLTTTTTSTTTLGSRQRQQTSQPHNKVRVRVRVPQSTSGVPRILEWEGSRCRRRRGRVENGDGVSPSLLGVGRGLCPSPEKKFVLFVENTIF